MLKLLEQKPQKLDTNNLLQIISILDLKKVSLSQRKIGKVQEINEKAINSIVVNKVDVPDDRIKKINQGLIHLNRISKIRIANKPLKSMQTVTNIIVIKNSPQSSLLNSNTEFNARRDFKKFSVKNDKRYLDQPIETRKQNYNMENFNLKHFTSKIGSNVINKYKIGYTEDDNILKPDFILSSNKNLIMPILNLQNYNLYKNLSPTKETLNVDYETFRSLKGMNQSKQTNSNDFTNQMTQYNITNDLDLSRILSLYNGMCSDRSFSCKNIKSSRSIEEFITPKKKYSVDFSFNNNTFTQFDDKQLYVSNDRSMFYLSSVNANSRRSSIFSVSQMNNNAIGVSKLGSSQNVSVLSKDTPQLIKRNIKHSVASKFKNSDYSSVNMTTDLKNLNSESVITENSLEFKINK